MILFCFSLEHSYDLKIDKTSSFVSKSYKVLDLCPGELLAGIQIETFSSISAP